MILYAAYLLLLPGILPGLFFLHSDAAPATYDQRQDGKYNIDVKFQNTLIALIHSGEKGLLTDLIVPATVDEFFSTPLKAKSNEQSESVVYETEERNREPYHVEIVRIEKEGESTLKENSGVKAEEKADSKIIPKKAEGTDQKVVVESTENVEEGKRGKSLWRHYTGRDLVDNAETIDAKEPEKIENVEEPQEGLSIKEETLKKARPGISLKKQLSKKEDEGVSSSPGERNDVGSSEVKPEELKLLGDGIENCGPGRYRDQSGVCQFDKNFH